MSWIPTLSRITGLLLAAAACLAAEPTQEEIMARAAAIYAGRLAQHAIDRDEVFTARVCRIAATLIAQVQRDPPTASWAWDLASTTPNWPCRALMPLLADLDYARWLPSAGAPRKPRPPACKETTCSRATEPLH